MRDLSISFSFKGIIRPRGYQRENLYRSLKRDEPGIGEWGKKKPKKKASRKEKKINLRDSR